MKTIKKPDLTLVGHITGSHGIKGLVKIKSALTTIDSFLNLTCYCFEGGDPIQIEPKFMAKNTLIASIKGITDKTKADHLKMTAIYTQDSFTSDPENNEFLYDDLIDSAVTLSQKYIGKIVDVYNYGAGDILTLKLEASKSTKAVDIPFLKAYFPHVNLQEKTIEIDPMALEIFANLNPE